MPGDVLLFAIGPRGAADARLVEAVNRLALEAVLTGESLPLQKGAAALAGRDLPIAARCHMLYARTAVTAGRSRSIVVGVSCTVLPMLELAYGMARHGCFGAPALRAEAARRQRPSFPEDMLESRALRTPTVAAPVDRSQRLGLCARFAIAARAVSAAHSTAMSESTPRIAPPRSRAQAYAASAPGRGNGWALVARRVGSAASRIAGLGPARDPSAQ